MEYEVPNGNGDGNINKQESDLTESDRMYLLGGLTNAWLSCPKEERETFLKVKDNLDYIFKDK